MWLLDGGLFSIPLTADNQGKSIKKKVTELRNSFVFENTFARFVTDALGRYEFENLPDTISERVLLQSLLWYGRVCIFDKDGNLLALPCAPSSAGLNIYGDYGSAWVFAANGQLNEQVKLFIHGGDIDTFLNRTNGDPMRGEERRGVLIRENAIMYPFIRIAMQFAEAVADTYRTLDIVRSNIKRPFIVTAEESIVPTVKKFLEQRELNYDSVISSGVFDPTRINLLPIDINGTSLTDATQLIEWYESQYKTLCGKKANSQMDKKGENLISAEVDINNEYSEFSVAKSLEYIQQGLDDVNAIFNTNIKVMEVEHDADIQRVDGAEPNDDNMANTDRGN